MCERIVLLIFCCLSMSISCIAQEIGEGIMSTDSMQLHEVGTQTDSVQTTTHPKKQSSRLSKIIDWLSEIDTTYISPNYYNYAAMLQNTNFYQSYTLSAQKDEHTTQTLTLTPRTAFKIGPYLGWRWIFLGYTFDIGTPSKAGKTTEFSLSLYSGKLGVDYVAIRSKGDFTFRTISGFSNTTTAQIKGLHFSGMEALTKKLNIYYIFNSKHFSYPAAFNQSTVQRRSVGSWKIGVRFDHQRIRFLHHRLPPYLQRDLAEGLQSVHLNQKNYSVSFGYSYNWVVARHLTLAASVSPAIGYTHKEGQLFNTRTFWQSIKSNLTNLDCITRVGFIYNNNRWFVGASAIHYLYNYHRERYSFSNSVLYANIYVGFNFHKRKEYR